MKQGVSRCFREKRPPGGSLECLSFARWWWRRAQATQFFRNCPATTPHPQRSSEGPSTFIPLFHKPPRTAQKSQDTGWLRPREVADVFARNSNKTGLRPLHFVSDAQNGLLEGNWDVLASENRTVHGSSGAADREVSGSDFARGGCSCPKQCPRKRGPLQWPPRDTSACRCLSGGDPHKRRCCVHSTLFWWETSQYSYCKGGVFQQATTGKHQKRPHVSRYKTL